MAKREIRFYKHYFNEFYVAQSDKVRRKIAQTLVWLQTHDRFLVLYLKVLKERKGYLKLELNLEEIYSECSAALMKDRWLSFSMDSRKRLKKLLLEK